MSFPIDKYKKSAKTELHSKDYIRDVTNYAKKLNSNGLPVIFSITHLAQCLNIKPSDLLKLAEYGNFFDVKNNRKLFHKNIIEHKPNLLNKIIKWAKSRFKNKNEDNPLDFFSKNNEKQKEPFLDDESSSYYYQDANEYNVINSNYKFFNLKKKRGGHREIMAPKSQLKNIQRWINYHILNKVDLHQNCFGFRKGKSIKDNASIHKNEECILNIDLLKFFDTITQKRVFGMFKELGYHPNLARLIAGLTTAKHKEWYWTEIDTTKYPKLTNLKKKKPKILPQGAPTSPAISNIICRRLDSRLYNLALKSNCNYSRYADDITFSGKTKNIPSIKLITKIIEEEGFYINEDKVGYYKTGSKQYVTGLAINDGVRVPRNKKREIRQILHYCKINGVEGHKKITGIQDKSQFKEWLAGNIAFINDIEPDIAQKYWTKFNNIDWD